MTVEESETGTKPCEWFAGGGGEVGHSMTANTHRRYAAECVSMSQRRENVSDKALLLQMATTWLHLAEFAEKNESADDSSPTV
jgi:hypothetical protein